MAFDDKKFFALATKGEVAGVAIKVGRIATSLTIALTNLKLGKDFSEQIDEIRQRSDELDEMFDSLTGYIPDG